MNCTLCGEPMQPGEEMFKFHGSLGPCPKPPLPAPEVIDPATVTVGPKAQVCMVSSDMPPKSRPAVVAILEELAIERAHQIVHLGYDPAHDDAHENGELAQAAAAYCMASMGSRGPLDGDELWPFTDGWNPNGTFRHLLVKAGAMIIAEIERLDRVAAMPEKNTPEDAAAESPVDDVPF